MEEEEIESQKYHQALVDEFINKNNFIAFKKLFHTKSIKKPKKSLFLSAAPTFKKPNRNEQRTATHTTNSN